MTVNTSATTTSGIRLIQNLLIRNLFNETGEVLIIQKTSLSMLTAGNTNLTAIAASTNPAKPKLRKENKF